MEDNYTNSGGLNGYGKVVDDYGQSQGMLRGRCPTYTMPGILQFLQTEWTKMEMERSQWEVERAEMQARIAFLQGERKGQENLKQDLVRRIKMLEFALKQERAKNLSMKCGNDIAMNIDITQSLDDEADGFDPSEELAKSAQKMATDHAKWKEDRQRLRQYLQEIGYGDSIAEMRQARVKQLLSSTLGESDAASLSALIEGLGTPGGTGNILSAGDQVESSVKDAESFLKSTEEDLACLDEALAGDADTDEALAEFDFLVSQQQEDGTEGEGAGEAQSSEKQPQMIPRSGHSSGSDSGGEEWAAVDQQLISKMKEQYRQERGKGGKRPGLQTMLDGAPISTTADDLEDMSVDEGGGSEEGGSSDLMGLRLQGMVPPPLDEADVKQLRAAATAEEEGFTAALGLGELARLTVANEAEGVVQQSTQPCVDSVDSAGIASSGSVLRSTWTAKYTLRSHFDSIRAVAFHPTDPVLLTASEDNTLKLWNLSKTVQAKKSASLDVEPVYTFRGHAGPVLSLVVHPTLEEAYSGGADGSVRIWRLPNSSVLDPYDAFDPSVHGPVLLGHTDAVWSMAVHPKGTLLLSASADQTVRLWQPNDPTAPLRHTYRFTDEPGVPTSLAYLGPSASQFALGFSSSQAFLVDVETGVKTCRLEAVQAKAENNACQINCVVTHPSFPLTITAHEDRQIRFYDNNTGKQVHSMVAHLDAVTSLAVDPNGLYLLSGSHDCSIRLWNLDNKTCVQEITSHRKKFEESINDVAFHPSKHYLASAGADALAKVFV